MSKGSISLYFTSCKLAIRLQLVIRTKLGDLTVCYTQGPALQPKRGWTITSVLHTSPKCRIAPVTIQFHLNSCLINFCDFSAVSGAHSVPVVLGLVPQVCQPVSLFCCVGSVWPSAEKDYYCSLIWSVIRNRIPRTKVMRERQPPLENSLQGLRQRCRVKWHPCRAKEKFKNAWPLEVHSWTGKSTGKKTISHSSVLTRSDRHWNRSQAL